MIYNAGGGGDQINQGLAHADVKFTNHIQEISNLTNFKISYVPSGKAESGRVTATHTSNDLSGKLSLALGNVDLTKWFGVLVTAGSTSIGFMFYRPPEYLAAANSSYLVSAVPESTWTDLANG